MLSIQKEEILTKLQVNNNNLYHEMSSKDNVENIGIKLSMCKEHKFEAIFTSDNVMNIQYAIVKGFNYREVALYMRRHFYFDPIRTNIPHAAPSYGTGRSNFENNYYRQIFCILEKRAHIQVKSKVQDNK